MLEDLRRERRIRLTLRSVARQRLGVILQPGNVWVIENAIKRTDETEEDLSTCLLRGWVEVLHHAIPHCGLGPDGKLPWGTGAAQTATVYRLTEGGWNAINRSHAWVVATFVVAVTSLFATVLGIWISL